jgi:hypothetical protein
MLDNVSRDHRSIELVTPLAGAFGSVNYFDWTTGQAEFEGIPSI